MTPDAAVLAEIRAAWDGGRSVALATDTVYGLAAPALDEAGVAGIFALKDRPVDKQMAVLVADLEQAGAWIVVTDTVRRLAVEYWPGGLTIVAARRPEAPAWVGDEATLGVRCPDDDVVRALAAAVGPLAATSANPHGVPTPTDAAGVAEVLPAVDLVVDGGPRSGAASTVVVARDDRIEVVREGAIPAVDIEAFLAGPP